MNFSFTNDTTKETLEDFIKDIYDRPHPDDNAKNKEIFELLKKMINGFISQPTKWDSVTELNRKKNGLTLLRKLTQYNGTTKEIDSIFILCSRFYIESSIISEESFFENITYKAQQLTLEHYDSFDYSDRKSIDQIRYLMPTEIIKNILNEESVKEYKNYRDNINTLSTLNENAKTQLKNAKDELDEVITSYGENKAHVAFNELTTAFGGLAENKKNELCFARSILIILGILLIIPFAWEAKLLAKTITTEYVFNIGTLIKLIPAISITAILAYFFRVALNNYNSAKTQLIQIELRQSLCMFIQNYSNFSKKVLKDDNNESLIKGFEAIIFSNIMPNESNIPSTFDGIEQLATLISSLKK